jgi:hypothetical protein
MGLRDKVGITGTNTGTGSITGYTSDKKYVVSSIDVGTAPTVGSNYYTDVTAFTLVDSDGTTAVDTTLGTLSGLTFKRFTETDGVNIYTTNAPLVDPAGIVVTLNIDDTDFSVTSSAGTNIAVGDRIEIAGTNTGAGSITGYTINKKYMVSSIDAGTVPLVTGFTLVDTDGTTAVVTTPGTLADLTYTRFVGTKEDELHATMITFNESKTI